MTINDNFSFNERPKYHSTEDQDLDDEFLKLLSRLSADEIANLKPFLEGVLLGVAFANNDNELLQYLDEIQKNTK